MELLRGVLKFLAEYFKSVKEDIFGQSDQDEDDDSFDIEEGPTETTRMLPNVTKATEDVTEHEISQTDLDHRRIGRAVSKKGSLTGQHQMHRPAMQVTRCGSIAYSEDYF